MVGNLRIVVSGTSFLTGWALLCVLGFNPPLSAQVAPPAAVNPAAPAPVDPNAAAAKAAPVIYAEPRITEEDDKKWKSTRQLKFSNALKTPAPTNAETKELIDGGNLFVDRMTLPKYRIDLHRYVIELARRSVEGALTNAAPRAILLKAMNDQGVVLLSQKPPHHPDVQLGVVILLGTLNAQPGSNTSAAVPYTGSYKALISVLEGTSNPLQCRITAASGLGRMGREAAVNVKGGDLTVVQRAEIAASLAKVLVATESQGKEDGKLWFRTRLAEALGDCGVAYDLNKGSGFIDALMSTGTNPAENLRVRAAALRAATQLQWDGQTNLPLILSEIAKLHLEIAKSYNAAIAAKSPVPTDIHHANMNIYLSFRPKTTAQGNLKWGLLNQITRPGLNQHGPAVNAAYVVVLPVVNHLVSHPKQAVTIPPALIAAVEIWVQANPPQTRQTTPVSPNALP